MGRSNTSKAKRGKKGRRSKTKRSKVSNQRDGEIVVRDMKKLMHLGPFQLQKGHRGNECPTSRSGGRGQASDRQGLSAYSFAGCVDSERQVTSDNLANASTFGR